MKQKYVRLERYNSIIIFPEWIEHSQFKSFNPISAGFCFVDAENKKVECQGESISLGLKSDEFDSMFATNQIFGF